MVIGSAYPDPATLIHYILHLFLLILHVHIIFCNQQQNLYNQFSVYYSTVFCIMKYNSPEHHGLHRTMKSSVVNWRLF